VNTTDSVDGFGTIFPSWVPPEPKPLAPPAYRQQALRLIISLNRSNGVSSLSFSELALQLRDQSLRGDVDPKFEPLSLESITAAVAELVHSRELIIVNDRTVIFPVPPAPAG